MSRINFNDVVTRKVVSGGDTFLEPLGNVQVSVYPVNDSGVRSTSLANLFMARIGSIAHPNPFVTGVDGRIDFWADTSGDYDIVLHDLNSTPRIADETIGWSTRDRPDTVLLLIMNAAIENWWTTVGRGHVRDMLPLNGTVNADGTIAAGTGFTVTYAGAGNYVVNFATSYSVPPTVVLTPLEVDRVLVAYPDPTIGYFYVVAKHLTTWSYINTKFMFSVFSNDS